MPLKDSSKDPFLNRLSLPDAERDGTSQRQWSKMIDRETLRVFKVDETP